MLSKRRKAMVLGASLFVAATAGAAEKPWKLTGELSHVKASGNTDAETISAKTRYEHNWSKAGLELEGGGLGTNSDNRTTAEQYYASEKVSWKFSERNFLFERFKWDKDRFAGIDHRYDASAGIGRHVIKTERNNLTAEIGGGYIKEDRIRSENEDFETGRGYLKYTFKLSPTAEFLQTGEYTANLEDGDDYRANTETGIVASINSYLSLKTSYQWKRVNRPPPGFEKDDTLISTALIVNY